MKKGKEPYKQLPQVLIEEMEAEIRTLRKLILHYLDRLEHGKLIISMELLHHLLAHEQELLETYMRDYKEMREYYAAQGLINVSGKDNAISGEPGS